MNIQYKDIAKRKAIMESKKDSVIDENCKLYRNRAIKSLLTNDIMKFMTECAKSPMSSSLYLSDMISLVENSKNEKILSYFESNILPNLKSFNENELKNIKSISENTISNQIKLNKICNRILENHYYISKSVNFDNVKDDFKMLINKCCESVSRIKDISLPAKVCISIEESKFVLESKNIDFNSKDLISTALDYYAIRENISGDITRLKSSIESNSYLAEDAKLYFSESVNDVAGSLSAIEIFMISPEKSTDLLKTTIEDILKVESYQIKKNMSALFDLLKEILISSNDEELCTSVYQEMIPEIYNIIFQNKLEDLDLKQMISDIKSLIEVEIEIANIYINKFDNETISNYMLHYMKALEELSAKLSELESYVYTKYNIECMSTSIEESDVLITLDEFKVFKFQNLINYSRKIDNYFKEKLSSTRNKASKFVKKLKSKIFGESTVYDALLENGGVDYVVCLIESIVDSVSNDEISKYCKDINESLLLDTPYNCYYISNENCFEIHIKENCMVSLTDTERCELIQNISFEDKSRMNDILISQDVEFSFDNNKIIDFFTENTEYAWFNYFLEACSLANIDKEVVTNIFESVYANKSDEDRNQFYHSANYNTSIYESADSSFEVQLEALQLIDSILEANNKNIVKNDNNLDKIKDNKTSLGAKKKVEVKDSKNIKNDKEKESDKKEEKEPKNPFAGINLNNIQLYLQGLKKKMKDMSAKEQEVCRQIDVSFNNFVKAVKNALVSDRREAIIKGSVIPSFSKCIKNGVILAGISFINPLAGVITAFGGLAMSKRLTKKERALLLDELEVELEMIEKEIQNADNKNQLKKERALMMQKKNLQRQYQRIKYNIRIGKDLIPGSSVGVGSNN